MAFHLTHKAKADLKDIARYTEKKWGIRQRNRYLAKIDNTFYELEKWPMKGRDYSYIRKGYMKYRVGQHLIFYRQEGDTDIEIVRILHEVMDVGNRLSEE